MEELSIKLTPDEANTLLDLLGQYNKAVKRIAAGYNVNCDDLEDKLLGVAIGYMDKFE